MQAIVDATLTTRPPAGTHWSSRALAEAQRVSDGTIRKIWRQHGLQPHRVGQFKLSTDPHFVEKLRDVVGLYLNPPANAVVFCVDEKSGIQALDRTRPVLPLRPGVPERQTHDYVRYGTTTLYAALRVLDGVVIGECRHRSQEFVQFLRRLDRATPPDQPLHLILDNLSAHKSPQVRRWLTRHPRVHFHFVPTSSSWLNLVERWFAEITRTRLRRGTFTSVPALERAIHDYLTHYNQHAKPFIWTKDADTILAKVDFALPVWYGSACSFNGTVSTHRRPSTPSWPRWLKVARRARIVLMLAQQVSPMVVARTLHVSRNGAVVGAPVCGRGGAGRAPRRHASGPAPPPDPGEGAGDRRRDPDDAPAGRHPLE